MVLAEEAVLGEAQGQGQGLGLPAAGEPVGGPPLQEEDQVVPVGPTRVWPRSRSSARLASRARSTPSPAVSSKRSPASLAARAAWTSRRMGAKRRRKRRLRATISSP